MKTDIYGYIYKIKLIDKNDERIKGNDGICMHNDLTILLRKDLNFTMLECVLRHEITHAILCLQGRCYHNKFTQEDLCEFVAFQSPYICKKVNKIIEVLKWKRF